MKFENLLTVKGSILNGPLVLTPNIINDDRGFFFESWNQNTFDSILTGSGQQKEIFVQDNQSKSIKGVLRGMHYQLEPYAQGKLLRCLNGQIFDVVVDIRSESITFGQWGSVYLDNIKHKQIWIPKGFAHGFLVMSDHAEVLYKTTDFWNRNAERALHWNDPNIGIAWPKLDLDFLISDKDRVAPLLHQITQKELFK